MSRVYLKTNEIDFDIESISDRKQPYRILMCTPDSFNVTEAINEFMVTKKGNKKEINKVDNALAKEQWNFIYEILDSLGYQMELINAQKGLEDIVFAANQSFPYINTSTGRREVIMSNMRKSKRMKEVAYFEAWYKNDGYIIHHLEDCCFESMGDALWYPGKNLIISGFGDKEYHRTDLEALKQVADITDIPVIGIRLEHKDFYHLNTTLSLIGRDTCIVFPHGVSTEGMCILRKYFKNIIQVSKEEAYAPNFACNAFSPDGRVVLIQYSCLNTIRQLEELGFIVIRINTSEFIKSGGSVFCMKMMLY
jgi:N-dimethylarginine dimethylaminohydrolase